MPDNRTDRVSFGIVTPPELIEKSSRLLMHERNALTIAPYRSLARKLVDEHGHQAWRWVRYELARRLRAEPDMPEQTFLRVDRDAANTCSAIIYEVFERDMAKREPPWCYREILSANPMARDIGNYLAQNSGLQPWVANGWLMHSWFETGMRLTGDRIYELSPGLAEHLQHVSLRGVTAGDVTLPYPVVYVLGEPRAGLKLYNSLSGWHDIEGIMVAEDPKSPETGGRCWRLLAIGKSHDPSAPHDDALLYFIVEMDPTMSIDDCLKVSTTLHRAQYKRLLDVGKIDQQEHDFIIDSWTTMFRWVMNVVMYATWPDTPAEHVIADPEARALYERANRAPVGSTKRRRLFDELKGKIKSERTYLGRGVPLLKTEAELHAEAAAAGRPRVTRTLTEGHKQRYHVGPNRERVEWRTKMPYWTPRDWEIRGLPESPARTHRLT